MAGPGSPPVGADPHLRLFEAIGRVHLRVLGRRLPLNGAWVCGAALADLGLPIDLLRGFALLARTAGRLSQIAEERRDPIAMDIYLNVDRKTEYVPPAPWHRPTRDIAPPVTSPHP
jgi:citrate synthase